ncbi:OmpA family protein [Variovorax sp. Root411]|uniref:OmpA family protein n=1 Tax=Variovorax sp. Root411 TaxID=1736530 RepID=UPI0009E6EEF6|nr:OmpA family protein [Variovorax sp. Root411]
MLKKTLFLGATLIWGVFFVATSAWAQSCICLGCVWSPEEQRRLKECEEARKPAPEREKTTDSGSAKKAPAPVISVDGADTSAPSAKRIPAVASTTARHLPVPVKWFESAEVMFERDAVALSPQGREMIMSLLGRVQGPQHCEVQGVTVVGSTQSNEGRTKEGARKLAERRAGYVADLVQDLGVLRDNIHTQNAQAESPAGSVWIGAVALRAVATNARDRCVDGPELPLLPY